MDASTRLLTTFAAMVTCTDAVPAAATPPAKPKMPDLLSASTFSVDPLDTVEPAIWAEIVLAMTFAPTMAEMATLPEAAMLSPSELMWDWSIAVRRTRPPERTMDPPAIKALTEFVTTFPKPVA